MRPSSTTPLITFIWFGSDLSTSQQKYLRETAAEVSPEYQVRLLHGGNHLTQIPGVHSPCNQNQNTNHLFVF